MIHSSLTRFLRLVMMMRVYKSIEEAAEKNRVIVLGNFDGVHLGHQELLKLARKIAAEKKLSLMVFTFYPQGQELFVCEFAYLATQEKKLEMFEQMGVDEVLSIPFDENIAKVTPEDFAYIFLRQKLNAKEVVVGFNYTFGYKGSGKAEDLKNWLANDDINVSIVPQLMVDGETVSSSLIRQALLAGESRKANKMLGYPYSLKGEVVKGRQVGRTIGIPTANIAVWEQKVLPHKGVYASLVHYNGKKYLGVLNIGKRPTVNNGSDTTVEVHILDFNADIYGEILEVELFDFLRDESKFEGLESLKNQINSDMQKVREILG